MNSSHSTLFETSWGWLIYDASSIVEVRYMPYIGVWSISNFSFRFEAEQVVGVIRQDYPVECG